VLPLAQEARKEIESLNRELQSVWQRDPIGRSSEINARRLAKEQDSARIYDRFAVPRDALATIRREALSRLTELERNRVFGIASSDIFSQFKASTDVGLQKIAPDVLSEFSSAYLRLGEESLPSRSQAALACRRVLKALADAVYAPRAEKVRGRDGSDRAVTDAQYRNRLVQAVEEASGLDAAGKLLISSIDQLIDLLKKLDDLSNKGLHDQITQRDAEFAVITTYLTCGRIIEVTNWTATAQASPYTRKP
jgi:hypothetical protein